MEDFNRILKETERLHSVDDKINHLLLRKRDAEIQIEKQKSDYRHKVFGWSIHPNLLALPTAIQSEVNRLIILRDNNILLSQSSNTTSDIADNTNSQDELLTAQEAANFLKISLSHFYKLTSQKLIPYRKPGGKLINVKKSDLENYKRQNEVQSMEQIEQKSISYIQKRTKK